MVYFSVEWIDNQLNQYIIKQIIQTSHVVIWIWMFREIRKKWYSYSVNVAPLLQWNMKCETKYKTYELNNLKWTNKKGEIHPHNRELCTLLPPAPAVLTQILMMIIELRERNALQTISYFDQQIVFMTVVVIVGWIGLSYSWCYHHCRCWVVDIPYHPQSHMCNWTSTNINSSSRYSSCYCFAFIDPGSS